MGFAGDSFQLLQPGVAGVLQVEAELIDLVVIRNEFAAILVWQQPGFATGATEGTDADIDAADGGRLI